MLLQQNFLPQHRKLVDLRDKLNDLLEPLLHFYASRRNYECMPRSGKVIVFDLDMPVKEAFLIASQNDISFACLWDGQDQQLVGMMTVTDLIDILLHYHSQTQVIKELFEHSVVRTWRQKQARNRPQQLVCCTPEDSLLTSIHALQEHKIHRLPIVSRGSLLHIMTHQHLLAYMVYNMSVAGGVADGLPIFRCTLEELGIGTFERVVTATVDKTVHEILLMFKEYHVSAVPLVDANGGIVDVFSRYDIVYLVRADETNGGGQAAPAAPAPTLGGTSNNNGAFDTNNYSLDFPVSEALRMKPKVPVFTCTKQETFGKVLRHLAGSRIHRLIVVDEDSRVVGVVSISDIFNFFLNGFYSLESTRSVAVGRAGIMNM